MPIPADERALFHAIAVQHGLPLMLADEILTAGQEEYDAWWNGGSGRLKDRLAEIINRYVEKAEWRDMLALGGNLDISLS